MSEPIVSVVIPAYKCGKYISSAIESVLSQTYTNFELIVVDDGSPDNTGQIIKKYEGRIKYIYQNNGGVSKARNTGIINSKGRYIAFLDSDDTWDNKKLEIQINIFEKHPEIDMLCSAFRNTKQGGLVPGRDYKDTFNFFKEYRYKVNEIFEYTSSMYHEQEIIQYHVGKIFDYLFLGNFILPSTVIAKKESIVKSGLFNEKLRVAEETDFFLNYSKNNIIGFIENPLVNYELPDPDNLSGKKNIEILIKNALKIQIDSFISKYNYRRKNNGYYLKGIAKTYFRLAYYYLSEYNTTFSRKYAVYSIKTYRYHIYSYMILLLSYAPANYLRYLQHIKAKIRTKV